MAVPKIAPNPWYRNIAKTWRFDLIAGVTLWGLVVPEAMAYAGLAGVPAEAGIYSVVFVVGIYALIGTSPLLVASSTSAAAATVGGIVMSVGGKPEIVVGAVSICVGLIYFMSGALRLGFVARFISLPIHVGFMFGLALFIVVSQLPKMLGLDHIDGNAVVKFGKIIANLGDANLAALIVGASALALLYLMGRYIPRVPGGLVVVALGIAAVSIFNLSDRGVKTVGKIPSGLPTLSWPDLSTPDWLAIFVASFGVVLVGLSEAASVEQSLADRRGEDVHLNRDLMAFGVGNTISGFFGGLVGAGSLSATSLNERAGAKSSFSSLVAALMALGTVLWFSGILTDLPEPVLGALVIHAVADHIRLSTVQRLRRFNQIEFWVAVSTVAGVLLFDVLAGLLLSMLGSLVYYVARTIRIEVVPDDDPDDIAARQRSVIKTDGSTDIRGKTEVLKPESGATDTPTKTITADNQDSAPDGPAMGPASGVVDTDGVGGKRDNVLALTVHGMLFYANAQVLVDSVKKAVKKALGDGHTIDTVIVHMNGQFRVDLTVAAMLDQLSEKLHDEGISLELVNTGEKFESELGRATVAAPGEAPAGHQPETTTSS